MAHLVQWKSHRRMAANLKPRGSTMTTFSNYSRQLLAGFGALAISVVLFANALATQAAEVQSIAGILA
jgi:hypothetical protein